MTTLFADDFNRAANAATLGSPWLAWAGTWGITAGAKAYVSNGRSALVCFAVVDTVADCTVSMTVASGPIGTNCGLIVRGVSDGNGYVIEGGNGSTTAKLYKGVAGSYSVLDESATNVQFITGDFVEVTLEGTSITVYHNGAIILEAVDATYQTATHHGLYTLAAAGASSTVTFGGFSIETEPLDPPNPPTGLTQTGATPVTVDVAWTAPATGETPTSYEVRVDGGAPVDVGLVTSHTIDTLTPSTAYAVEVRTVAATGTSTWASVVATTADVSGEGIALEAGHTYGTQLLDDTYSISIRRGLRPNGVTDDLEPATFAAVIKGSSALNPLTNDDVRPNRPIRLRATLDGGATWTTVWTGRILRARLAHDPDEKDDATAYRLNLTGTDLVAELNGIPSETAVDGNLHQRVGAVLDPTGLPYVVDDPSTPGAGATLPTDARDVLGQLRLIRDTGHALMYVNRDGGLAVLADNARPRVLGVPDWIATDEIATTGIHFTEIDPALDTDAVVNVLTLTLLDGAGNPVTVHTDDDSRDAWGDKAQAVTVNDGVPETHADLWLASRVDPELVPESIRFIVQERLPQAIEPTVNATHLAAAAGVELYDVVRVTRDGMPTTDLLVREITHTISPRAWAVGLGLRVPEILATRWDDVPGDLTWDDVPPTLTWRDAVDWHPYL